MSDDLEENDRSVTEILSQNFPGGTEEKYENSHPEYTIS
jgi:hypothetical protein